VRGRSIGEDSLAVFDEKTVVVGGRSENVNLFWVDLGCEQGRPTRGLNMSNGSNLCLSDVNSILHD
jgi:hypothetical protein